ncbi:Flagellar M-ring protein FliF [hydrothermal vent metagenome]|uniref:Flagellar M-ring protein FliF n=1 Tax=hydrothermal vent metagenome TaxID=652676 RepID=A0A3B0UFD6_9ZZZZ
MNAAINLIRTLGLARVAAIAALSTLVLGFAVFAFMRLSQPLMSTLFTDLSFEDSTSILSELEGLNIPFEVRQDGAVILVPKDDVLRVRMRLAENGLPTGGGVGYEIFDKSDTLGATSFVQNLNRLRALEGELARTIKSIDRVKAARVHLVLPERKLFTREASEPTASILLKLRGTLSGAQVKAIQHIVAAAVKDMSPGRVSVVDDRGQLLASGTGGSAGDMNLTSIEERNRTIENRLRLQIENIVANIVGPGAVKVQVAAELNLSRSTETSEVYDPEGQVVRSTQSSEETASSGLTGGGGVTVGNELPGAGEGEGGGGASDTNNKSEEVVNYEISKRTSTQVLEAGGVKRLSVAVLVDGIYGEDANKNVTYAPRPQEQIDQIIALVRSAIGFDRNRGDTVEVINLRFAPSAKALEFSDAPGSFFDLTKDDYFRLAEIGVLGLMALLVFFFVVRPLLRQALSPDTSRLAIEDQSGSGGSDAAGSLPAPGAAPEAGLALPSPEALARLGIDPNSSMSVTDLIDTAKMTGEVQENSVRKIAEIVKGNPDEAIGIVRQWIQTPA